MLFKVMKSSHLSFLKRKKKRKKTKRNALPCRPAQNPQYMGGGGANAYILIT
jgi:hypothetical protein